MHDGQPGALVTLLDIRVAEHDDRVAILKELVGSERELVPRPNSLLKDRDGRLLTLVRPPTGQVFGVAPLPREVLRPVRQRRLQVALRELLVALAQQVGLASHCGTPVAQERWLSGPPSTTDEPSCSARPDQATISPGHLFHGRAASPG